MSMMHQLSCAMVARSLMSGCSGPRLPFAHRANSSAAPAGVLFFGLVLFSGPLDPMLAAIGLTPLMAAVLVGAAQNVFSKSSKYSLFDPCKEMAYIPLDQETQLKASHPSSPV